MGLIWAVVWAPLGPLIGAIVDPDGSMDEPWIAVGTIPGFLCGVLFSIVFGVVARRRRVSELSVPAVGAWGAAAGALLGVLTRVTGDLNPALPAWFTPVVVGSLTVLSASSAAASLALAKRAERMSLRSGESEAQGQLPR
jgi:hypothetical protein